MSRDSVLARGRAFAVTGFTATCLIQRVQSLDTNPQTGVVTPTYVTIYTGACRVQSSGGASPVDVAQANRYEVPSTLQIPVAGTSDVRVEDRVTILTNPNDTDLVNRVFHITGLHRATHKTARRLEMQNLVG